MDSSAIAIVAQSQRRMQTDVEVTLLGKKLLLPVSRLISAEQQAHYVLLRFEDGATTQLKGRLDELEPQLADFPFFRSHKSYLANLSYVTGIDRELLVFSHERRAERLYPTGPSEKGKGRLGGLAVCPDEKRGIFSNIDKMRCFSNFLKRDTL